MAPEGTPEKRPVVEALERMWAQAVTAASSVEEEAARVVQKAQTVAGWSQDEMRRQVADLTERLASQRREWERGVDQGVRSALQRLRLPRREDVRALSDRLAKVSERLDALERSHPDAR